ncbi:hypothetical protein CDAR_396661 [Caerostris darwini]|uniref:Uncharacterized protein n=1 Tax=Caerostris darwini TaxID=1538125 RepID=A0AAV4PPB5_9ARAC|nr:hypothetical protein CDAR_396661 [Caerostris darwini]
MDSHHVPPGRKRVNSKEGHASFSQIGNPVSTPEKNEWAYVSGRRGTFSKSASHNSPCAFALKTKNLSTSSTNSQVLLAYLTVENKVRLRSISSDPKI